MQNNTLYASKTTYEFEKARISESKETLETVKRNMKGTYPENLEYLDDFYDKDTGTSGTAFKDSSYTLFYYLCSRSSTIFSEKSIF